MSEKEERKKAHLMAQKADQYIGAIHRKLTRILKDPEYYKHVTKIKKEVKDFPKAQRIAEKAEYYLDIFLNPTLEKYEKGVYKRILEFKKRMHKLATV